MTAFPCFALGPSPSLSPLLQELVELSAGMVGRAEEAVGRAEEVAGMAEEVAGMAEEVAGMAEEVVEGLTTASCFRTQEVLTQQCHDSSAMTTVVTFVALIFLGFWTLPLVLTVLLMITCFFFCCAELSNAYNNNNKTACSTVLTSHNLQP